MIQQMQVNGKTLKNLNTLKCFLQKFKILNKEKCHKLL